MNITDIADLVDGSTGLGLDIQCALQHLPHTQHLVVWILNMLCTAGAVWEQGGLLGPPALSAFPKFGTIIIKRGTREPPKPGAGGEGKQTISYSSFIYLTSPTYSSSGVWSSGMILA